jgi:hypothetical protein
MPRLVDVGSTLTSFNPARTDKGRQPTYTRIDKGGSAALQEILRFEFPKNPVQAADSIR